VPGEETPSSDPSEPVEAVNTAENNVADVSYAGQDIATEEKQPEIADLRLRRQGPSNTDGANGCKYRDDAPNAEDQVDRSQAGQRVCGHGLPHP